MNSISIKLAMNRIAGRCFDPRIKDVETPRLTQTCIFADDILNLFS